MNEHVQFINSTRYECDVCSTTFQSKYPPAHSAPQHAHPTARTLHHGTYRSIPVIEVWVEDTLVSTHKEADPYPAQSFINSLNLTIARKVRRAEIRPHRSL